MSDPSKCKKDVVHESTPTIYMYGTCATTLILSTNCLLRNYHAFVSGNEALFALLEDVVENRKSVDLVAHAHKDRHSLAPLVRIVLLQLQP